MSPVEPPSSTSLQFNIGLEGDHKRTYSETWQSTICLPPLCSIPLGCVEDGARGSTRGMGDPTNVFLSLPHILSTEKAYLFPTSILYYYIAEGSGLSQQYLLQ